MTYNFKGILVCRIKIPYDRVYGKQIAKKIFTLFLKCDTLLRVRIC